MTDHDEREISPEESFRSSLRDLVVLCRALTPVAATVKDLLGMAELAIKNDGQLSLLFQMVKVQAQAAQSNKR